MAHRQHTLCPTTTEEAVIALFCLVDDAYYVRLNPCGRRYESLKRLCKLLLRDRRLDYRPSRVIFVR